MFSDSLLAITSTSQWALFIGIGLIIFGWIEKKENFILAGQLVFLALGIFASYFLLTDSIPVPEIGSGHLTKELTVLTYLKVIAVFSGLTVISLFLKIFKIKFQKYFVYLLVFFALMLFFMVFNIQQMTN